jgi:hypothetical protein
MNFFVRPISDVLLKHILHQFIPCCSSQLSVFHSSKYTSEPTKRPNIPVGAGKRSFKKLQRLGGIFPEKTYQKSRKIRKQIDREVAKFTWKLVLSNVSNQILRKKTSERTRL